MFERTSYCVAEGDRELEVCVEVTFSSRSTKEINVTVSLSQDVVQTRAASGTYVKYLVCIACIILAMLVRRVSTLCVVSVCACVCVHVYCVD